MTVKLYSINAFPTATQQDEWIHEVWDDANTYQKVDYAISGEIHKIVRSLFIVAAHR
jgi:hypothetical protein